MVSYPTPPVVVNSSGISGISVTFAGSGVVFSRLIRLTTCFNVSGSPAATNTHTGCFTQKLTWVPTIVGDTGFDLFSDFHNFSG
ncbi:hypothetical protein DPMN_081069 [Dreissena polymorpha]|uniref:Uncharacterized protein n=1 Tax=Dreissena polymorpha TaxID=45954 RepID=A0A9D3Y873_DREPO|nr:hypothetical protein DPMN_081069 [Dreissena polymorpha]